MVRWLQLICIACIACKALAHQGREKKAPGTRIESRWCLEGFPLIHMTFMWQGPMPLLFAKNGSIL